ncbi:MAG: hypothetical protein JSC189_001102 [Candidatus Tokpelaia sp. JSC189]|nr:MAG: hypothetical protein JSC189_001102 [Candidatus Tokpelaia sp. JSC189]
MVMISNHGSGYQRHSGKCWSLLEIFEVEKKNPVEDMGGDASRNTLSFRVKDNTFQFYDGYRKTYRFSISFLETDSPLNAEVCHASDLHKSIA